MFLLLDNQKLFFKRLGFIVGGGVVLYWALNNLGPIFDFLGVVIGFIFPFILGGFIAFLLNIPMRFIERHLTKLVRAIGKKEPKKEKSMVIRLVSLVLAIVVILALLIGAAFIVAPQIGETVSSLSAEIPGFMRECQKFFQEVSKSLPGYLSFLENIQIDWNNVGKQITGFLSSFGTQAVSSSISAATAVFSGIGTFFMSFIFALYILLGKESLARQVKIVLRSFLPKKAYKKFFDITALIDSVFSGFFSGQCLEALILGSLCFIGMSIFRFPYAAMISVLIAVLSFIPIIGAFTGCFVGAFFILIQNPIQAIWFVVYFLVLQQIEGNFIYPRVVGSSIGLPAMWVLAAVSLGGSIFGIAGMILFIPLTSVIYALIKQTVKKRVKKQKLERLKAEEEKAKAKQKVAHEKNVPVKTVKETSGQAEKAVLHEDKKSEPKTRPAPAKKSKPVEKPINIKELNIDIDLDSEEYIKGEDKK